MGEEALSRGRAGKQTIFLSGWLFHLSTGPCHVARIVSNEEVAAVMNRDFVNIKVYRKSVLAVDRVLHDVCSVDDGRWRLADECLVDASGLKHLLAEPMFRRRNDMVAGLSRACSNESRRLGMKITQNCRQAHILSAA